MSVIEKINGIAVQANIDGEQTAIAIGEIISRLEIGRQFELHSQLSEIALTLLVSYRDKLNINQEVKEQFVWWYFREKVQKSGKRIDSNLLSELFHEYASSKSVGLESIVIQAIKSDVLTEAQLLQAEAIFSSKTFEKESFAYTIRKKIDLGAMLDKTDVSKLLDFRLYLVLEKALDNKLVPVEGLDYVTSPSDGTPDKKARLKLFQKAQLIRAQS
ncbi:hypothetical protein PAESOLCIP111_05538 [Paenibacillus solanacearum]|uniref:Uncharacterized protein n=1 Tax=Paenibacillus solanacearum TaxID=2048548 RepID=A0A916NS89_9BACL|nr:hypothetical protein [Paenibacillus solanacearum]CAG7648149.1 hypothetical protein PAESOLCIP111_05538 [Paenibacillus solanacearum]